MSDEVTRTLTQPGGEPLAEGAPFLEVVAGPWPGKRFPVGERGMLIGRDDGAEVHLEADGLSRKHAKLVNNGQGLINVLDLGSTNGTYLNGRRIDVAVLRDGDEIRVGTVVLRFGLRRPGRAEHSGSPHPASVLTAREYEVAQLVAEGLTNAEIGKRLFITPRTVATHLANIYDRLGMRTRAALARAITEAGQRR